jgi:two-component system, LuxR family, sensor kinase FixL
MQWCRDLGTDRKPSMFSSGERVRTSLVGASIALILLASAIAYHTVSDLLIAQDWVDHTQSVIDHVDRLLSDLREAEIGTRAYVISGNEPDLRPYAEGSQTIPREFKQLRSLTADNPQQIARLNNLEPLIKERLQTLVALIQARKTSPYSPPAFVDQLDPAGSSRRGPIRDILDQMTDEENQLYQARRQAADWQANLVLLLVVGVSVVASLAILIVLYRMTMEVRRRRVAEAGLTEVNSSLERRVEARTQELASTNTRLLELQAEFSHASRLNTVEQMGRALAHELKQPLTAIANYAKAAERMLVQGDPDAVARVPAILGKTAEQALRAGEIIDHLREFVAKGATSRESQLLEGVTKDAATLTMAGMPRGDVSIELSVHPDARIAVIDRIQIQQVLVNIMRNAIETMAQSDRRALSITAVPRSERHIEIAFADSGHGIQPDIARQRFKPFVTTKSQGMGVGLSVCRTIVEAHGGTIWADANPTGGTIFRFTVPTEGKSAPPMPHAANA